MTFENHKHFFGDDMEIELSSEEDREVDITRYSSLVKVGAILGKIKKDVDEIRSRLEKDSLSEGD